MIAGVLVDQIQNEVPKRQLGCQIHTNFVNFDRKYNENGMGSVFVCALA